MKNARFLLLSAFALLAAGCSRQDPDAPAAEPSSNQAASPTASAPAAAPIASPPPAPAALAHLPASVSLGDTLNLPVYGPCIVVDTVDCTQTDHRFADYPAGASRVETILGKPCRVLDVQPETASWVDWRLGEGKDLRPNGAYVVVIEYPDDEPRAFHVRNYGNNSRRSFYTGQSNGDAFEGPIVHHKPESLKIPQSGKFATWSSLTFLGLRAATRNDKGKMDIATEGFEVAISQYKKEWHPLSAGIAVSRILLCKIVDEKAAWAKIPFPPKGLPRRHIFWREEMADGVTGEGGLCDSNQGLDWIEQKFRAMKIFAQNTYCKDLLEFGHNQGWDVNWKRRNNLPGAKHANWMWGGNGHDWDIWGRIVPMAVDQYGFDVLPYYEYGGAAGDMSCSTPPLGPQKRCEPLDIDNKPKDRGINYTHIWWSEGKLRVDITDPDTLAELEYILDCTIFRFKEQVEKGGFLGVLMRPRPGQWAIGFGDATRARFAMEENCGQAVSRADLKANKALYDKYIAWFGKRRAKFMDDIRKYLEDGGVKNAVAILENDDSETGYPLKDGGSMTTDDLPFCQAKLPGKNIVDVNDPSVVGQHRYLQALRTPSGTWGCWEWQHASPFCDPEHYQNLKNVWIAMPFHALFTVTDPACLKEFDNANGTSTIIRHYDLNEGTLFQGDKPGSTGYCMADWEHAGRACMIAEVNAMANGDPVNIGYLMGSNYTRGFPEPVREFNLNFLALPALPSKKIDGACADSEVVLRRIDCTKYGKGTYYEVVHVGYTGKRDVQVRFPSGIRQVTDINGRIYPVDKGVATLPVLKPWQLLTLWAAQ